MKEMLKTLGEQAEREKAAESYIDSLFSNIVKATQPIQ
jgi:chorismate mutase